MYPGYGYGPPPYYYCAPPNTPPPPMMNLEEARRVAKKIVKDAEKAERKTALKLKTKEEEEKKKKDADKKTADNKKVKTFTTLELFSVLMLLSPLVGPAWIMVILSLSKTVASNIMLLLK